MGWMGKKSQLKSKVIKKVWLNKKDYKFLDFDFKVVGLDKGYRTSIWGIEFDIEVYNCGVLILKLKVDEDIKIKEEERFTFEVKYFNPQTDNDCYSINHILGVCSESVPPKLQNKDMGNAEVFQNQFVFRKKKSYYSHTKIWIKGDIGLENCDKQLSYDFATDEYINYIKHIFGVKRMQRRKTKEHFKSFLTKMILLENL